MTNAKTTPKYATVTWDEMHRDTRALAKKLMENHKPFKGILAIARGGMIPAAILARELGCRMVDTICAASYSGEAGTQGDLVFLKDVQLEDGGEGWLIVDDLVDSGKTAKLVRKRLPNATYACIYAKPDGKPTTDYFVSEVDQDVWILFPWDTAPLFHPPLVGKD